jgi:simple sugar transport system ATP-binding protein
VLRSLSENGLSIVFITHKLNEVMQIADRITIMRGGKVVGSTTPQETNERDLAKLMVGRPVSFEVEKGASPTGETVLSVKDLSVADERGLQVVDRVSFEVKAGEVLGLAGVLRNGQSQLVQALAGLRPTQAGSIVFLGKDTARLSPRQLAELGMAYIPEDRMGVGLVLPFNVSDNLALKGYYKKPFASGFALQQNAFDSNVAHLVSTYGIKATDIKSPVSYLSGGNQQKVVLAREISKPIRLLIAAQPTRGLDVGTIELVHRYLVAKREAGCAILLMSTDLDEIMSLSDRIAVMYRGRIVGELPAAQTSKEDLGMMMAGAVISDTRSKGTHS